MAQRHVRARRVFYIPGYDPIHPRRYRELYRSESAKQSALSDYEVSVSPGQGDHYGWKVAAEMEGQITKTDIEVLVWSDIVRSSMKTGIAATYWQLARTSWIYISSGALRRLMWLRKGPVIAALYPVVMLLMQALLAYLAGRIVARMGAWLIDSFLGLFGWSFVWGATLFHIAVTLAIAVAVLRGFRRIDNRLFAYYLMHDYAYSSQLRGANPPELDARLAEFRAALSLALISDVDEVLVVGHSSGAHLAVSVLADLIRSKQMRADGPTLSFLSLGQVIPMASFLPDASQLRADLHLLSQSDALTWVDVTAPGDGCAFALCDPVCVSGVAPSEGKRWPLILSAAFTQTLSDKTWAKLRWRFFRLHFQYLCAFDNLPGKPDDYDYFRITAGPLTLADRLAGRKPSKSRIDIPASVHTHMAA